MEIFWFFILGFIVIFCIIVDRLHALKEENISLRKSLGESNKKITVFESEHNNIIAKENAATHLQEELIQREKQLEQELKQKEYELYQKILFNIEKLIKDKAASYKWLSGMMADYLTIKETQYAEILHVRGTAAALGRELKINELKGELKQRIKENKILRYELEYIKNAIPNAEEFIEYDEMGIDINSENFISNFISREEYDKLSDTEKNIRALEYYKNRKKTKWEIGRDFERYIGYKFENDNGAIVEYHGMQKGLNDLGRDLIVHEDNTIFIVQCKYWSKDKIIHEKHINQLFGTFIMYKLEHPKEKKNIKAMFVTHTILSDVAKRFANALNILVRENIELGEYPVIKCHNGHDEFGLPTKIYHLPMDQQYDKTIINTKHGDFWAFTIEEAEKKGYQRAHKWHPNSMNPSIPNGSIYTPLLF
ncbi:hypothetical protein AGMMS50268_21110 [Spirochaetia bacterium]|nr:hypothetical protein AGMMS50268_21110 [Spirochaetia bacterium]